MANHKNQTERTVAEPPERASSDDRDVTAKVSALLSDSRYTVGRPLGFWHGDLYTLAEARKILNRLERLRNAGAEYPDWSNKAALGEAWSEVSGAGYVLAGAMDLRLNDLLALHDTAGHQALSKQVESLRNYLDREPDSDDMTATRHRLHATWHLLGASQTPLWRGILKDLKAGKLSLREANGRHPSIPHALHLGVLDSGMSQYLVRRWLLHQELSETCLKTAIDTVLKDKSLMEKRGRSHHGELIAFTETIIAAAEVYSGKKVTASDHKDTRSKGEGIKRTTSAGVEFVYECVEPLYPLATLESSGRLIRQVREQQRARPKQNSPEHN